LQVANLVLPLVTVPFLARQLGPAVAGEVAAAQSFGLCVGLLAEYGLTLSGSRRVGAAGDCQRARGEAVAATVGAQVVLLALALLLAMLARPWVPVTGSLFGAALLWMIPQSLHPQWYFLGRDQTPRLAALMLAGRLLGTGLVFALVRGPEDGAWSLALQGLAGTVAVLAAFSWMARETEWRWPGTRAVARVLREGAGMFAYRAGTGLQQTAGTLVLARYLDPAALGAWSGAERLARAAGSLMEPAVVALYARLAAGGAEDPAAWQRQGRRWLWLAGGATALGLAGAAGWITQLVLGPGYEASARVLQVLSVWPLFQALGQNQALNGLALRGRDAALNTIAGGVGVFQLLLLGVLARNGCPLGWLALAPVAGLAVQYVLLRWASEAK